MNEIIYPTILTYEDDIIYGGVPDLDIDNYATYGKTIEEVLNNLKEIITLTLVDLEDEKKEFPKASEVKELKRTLGDNQELLLINMWLPYEKSKVKKVVDIESIFKNKSLDIKEIQLKAKKIMEKNITAMRYLQDK